MLLIKKNYRLENGEDSSWNILSCVTVVFLVVAKWHLCQVEMPKNIFLLLIGSTVYLMKIISNKKQNTSRALWLIITGNIEHQKWTSLTFSGGLGTSCMFKYHTCNTVTEKFRKTLDLGKSFWTGPYVIRPVPVCWNVCLSVCSHTLQMKTLKMNSSQH